MLPQVVVFIGNGRKLRFFIIQKTLLFMELKADKLQSKLFICFGPPTGYNRLQ